MRRLQEKLVNPAVKPPRRNRLNAPVMPQLGRVAVKIGRPDSPVNTRKFVVRGTLANAKKGKADE
jgi:hypothetical protein